MSTRPQYGEPLYEYRDEMIVPSDNAWKDLYFRARNMANRGDRLERTLSLAMPAELIFVQVLLCYQAALKAKQDMERIASEEGFTCDWEGSFMEEVDQ